MLQTLNGDKRLFNQKTNDGFTALHHACAFCPADIVMRIAEKSEVNEVNKNGKTPIFEAVSYNNLAAARAMMFEVKGVNINHKNNDGKSIEDNAW